jgi:hypothetical protein
LRWLLYFWNICGSLPTYTLNAGCRIQYVPTAWSVLCCTLIAIVRGRDESRNLMWLAMALKKTKQIILFHFLNNYLCIKHINSECTYKIILYWNFPNLKTHPKLLPGRTSALHSGNSRFNVMSCTDYPECVFRFFSQSLPQKSIPWYYPKLCDDGFTLLHFQCSLCHTSYHSTLQNSSYCAGVIQTTINTNTRPKVWSVIPVLRIHHCIEIADLHTVCNTRVLWSVLPRWAAYKSNWSWRTVKGLNTWS